MASSRPAPAPTGPRILPLAPALWEHHSQSLAPWMREWRDTHRLPPVLLLTGLEGVGKREVAYHLSQWILCERTGFGPAAASLFGDAPSLLDVAPSAESPLQGCGECPACHRAIENAWVDFREIRSQQASDDEETGNEGAGPARAGSLKIDQFRELRATLGFGSHEGGYRITLITNAETLTPQAANSLLKLLEEPPRDWILLLTATDANLLLPTLVSRCQRVRLRPFPQESLEHVLTAQGVNPDRARDAARLAQGSWKRALQSGHDEFWEERRAVFRFLRDPAREVGGLLDWTAKQPRHLETLVSSLEQQALELLTWSTSPGDPALEDFAWTCRDGAFDLVDHARLVTRRLGGRTAAREFWLERARRLGQARRELSTPMNRKILAQELLYSWVIPQ